MSALPTNEVSQSDLVTWNEMQEQLSALKSAEMLLRMKIFKGMFLDPHEGTNTIPLAGGWVLKAVYPITRTPDVALLTAMAAELRTAGIPLDDVIRAKPELSVTHYKLLTEERRHLMDQVLQIKPGSPQLQIVLPKRVVETTS